MQSSYLLHKIFLINWKSYKNSYQIVLFFDIYLFIFLFLSCSELNDAEGTLNILLRPRQVPGHTKGVFVQNVIKIFTRLITTCLENQDIDNATSTTTGATKKEKKKDKEHREHKSKSKSKENEEESPNLIGTPVKKKKEKTKPSSSNKDESSEKKKKEKHHHRRNNKDKKEEPLLLGDFEEPSMTNKETS